MCRAHPSDTPMVPGPGVSPSDPPCWDVAGVLAVLVVSHCFLNVLVVSHCFLAVLVVSHCFLAVLVVFPKVVFWLLRWCDTS